MSLSSPVPACRLSVSMISGLLYNSTKYGICPKILYTKVSDKMAYANSADNDQTVSSGAVKSGSTLFAIPQSIVRKNCMKSKI